MAVDLIIYGIVAAGLVLWLRGLLGTRHGDERSRPNPYMRDPAKPSDAKGAGENEKSILEGEIITASPVDTINDLAENPTPSLSITGEEAHNGLLAIAKADKNFDINDFVSKAQDAFAFTVEAYANGDRDTLSDLTGDKVFDAFDRAISERDNNGYTQRTEVLSFHSTKVLSAELKGKQAIITLRFAAQQINVIKDKDGNIIAGHESAPFEMVDIWTFSRKTATSDPRWFLIETRSETDDDNDVVPDTV